MNTPQYCENCGSPLEPGLQFCENCGNQVAANQVSSPSQAPPQAPTPRPAAPRPEALRPAPKKSKPPVWLLPVGIGCIALLCLGILAVVAAVFLLNPVNTSDTAVVPEYATTIPTAAQTSLPTETSPEPTLEDQPTATVPAPPQEETAIPPTEPAPTAANDLSTQQSYTRWALDYSLQWEFGENDIFITDINQDHSWIIALKQPQNIVMVIPPHPLAYYPNNILFTVKVQPSDDASSGPYGAICHFQDENNYYLVEIQGDNYGIGKMVGGVFSPLTDPYWQKSQFISDRDANNYIELGVVCLDYSIGVSINGLGETYPIDDPDQSFTGGAVALFGASSLEPQDMLMGIFYFKDLTIEEIE